MPVKFTYENPLLKAWLLVHQTHNLLHRAENATFNELGLASRKHLIMMAIDSLKSPVMVSDVARWLDRNPNTISMLVDQLEEAGLVKRTRDLSDHRSVRLELTPQSKKLLKDGKTVSEKLIQDAFSDVTPEELVQLATILRKVRLKTLAILELDVHEENIQIIDAKDKQNGRKEK
jgi:DNA-binding MarR family transcriptional regulator